MIRRARRLALIALVGMLVLGPAAAVAAAACPRASLTDVENDVMCVSCRESLAVAQAPQADSERSYIRSLIAQCMSKQQIEQNLVAQYGVAVLGKPPASGFNLSVYILPPAILALGVAILAVALPRWRRRSRALQAPEAASGTAPVPDPQEAARLDQELSEFRG